ncbi:MAG TPA: RHS repeat-associated core domain-containing protein, partial [Nitrospiraceae bacterium]
VSFPNTSIAAGYRSIYTYDSMDDLIKVKQQIGTSGTIQNRFFMYDSLRRLIRARNPEQNVASGLALSDPLTSNSQWSVAYVYDPASNLSQKTESRANAQGSLLQINYTYDELNRLLTRGYLNDPSATPAVSYSYDSTAVLNSNGRLTSVTSVISSTNYLEFDSLGRIKKSSQTTAGVSSPPFDITYEYDRAGSMTKQTYPSGKVVTFYYDLAARMAGVRSGTAGPFYAGALSSDSTNRIQYSAQGAVSALKLGNGLWEHSLFNTRLQPTEIGLGTSSSDSSKLKLLYTYNTTGQTNNNGNILTQRIVVSSPALDVTQTYGYDALNRLTSASEGANWSQNFTYDRWGNRTSLAGSGVPIAPTPTIDSNTNRFQSGYVYDSAGNITSDGAGNVFQYDGENRQTSHVRTGVSTSNYFYDGDGRRVIKAVTQGGVTTTTVFVYNAMGQMIAEYSDPMPAREGGTKYLMADHLGSTRVVTGSDASVKARHDYLPFGEEIPWNLGGRGGVTGYNASDSTRQRFTQKERDSESGLDYFLARYYSSAQGRFTSADEPFVGQDRKDPQSWNLFTYARNNPLLYVDPTGNDYVLYQYDKDGKVINTFQVKSTEELEKLGYKVTGGNDDGSILYVHGKDAKGNDIAFTAKYIAGDPGGVKVQAQYTISALGDAVGAELDRSADASKELIGGFAVGTAVVGTGIGGAAYLTGTALAGSSITTLGLSEAGVAPGAVA